MADRDTCDFCGDPIEPGQAWLRAEFEGDDAQAHAGCLYREERDPLAAGWEPQEASAG
jgi:hypothetical protein